MALGPTCRETSANVTNRIAVLEPVSCTTELLLETLRQAGALGVVVWTSDGLLDMGENPMAFAGLSWDVAYLPAVEVSHKDALRLLQMLNEGDDVVITMDSSLNGNPWVAMLSGPAYIALMRVFVPCLWAALAAISILHLRLRIHRYGFRPRSRVPQLLTVLISSVSLGNMCMLIVGREGQGRLLSQQPKTTLTAISDMGLLTGVSLMATIWRVSLRSKHAQQAGSIVKRHTCRLVIVMILLWGVSVISALGISQGIVTMRIVGFLLQFAFAGGLSLYFILSARRLLKRLATVTTSATEEAAAAPRSPHKRVASVCSIGDQQLTSGRTLSAGGPAGDTGSHADSHVGSADDSATTHSSKKTVKKLGAAAGVPAGSRRRRLALMAYWLRIASIALVWRLFGQVLLTFVPHTPAGWLAARFMGAVADSVLALSVVMSVRRSGDPVLPRPCAKGTVPTPYTVATMTAASLAPDTASAGIAAGSHS
eukprot:PLAT6407.3.p1 GENE.PLAT6407.3~~PLAT6407.3.p1  ORF type:complete len:482 (+),score=158.58 PLAT6407.3:278-1723(+)